VCWLFSLVGVFSAIPTVRAQSNSNATKPYATLDHSAVAYRGPARAAERELPEGVAIIGMILPLKGPQESEGKAVLEAAHLALEEEQFLGPLPDGRRLTLVARNESGQWGQASTEIFKLIEQDHALVMLTSANGAVTHLAEQIANKISIPILTFSSDPTTTQTNVPWLFRLGPNDTDQARAFCQRIYSELGLRKVMLIVQMDHDGRIGGAEFEKAARGLHLTSPLRLELTDSTINPEAIQEMIQAKDPEAIVIWTDSPSADKLLPLLQETRPSTPVFLCRKAAQLRRRGTRAEFTSGSNGETQNSGELFTVDSSYEKHVTAESKFEQLYLARTGTRPGLVAHQAYEAVHLMATALRSTGANRILLRDSFANEGKPSATKSMPFDAAGNDMQEFAIVRLHSPAKAFPGQ